MAEAPATFRIKEGYLTKSSTLHRKGFRFRHRRFIFEGFTLPGGLETAEIARFRLSYFDGKKRWKGDVDLAGCTEENVCVLGPDAPDRGTYKDLNTRDKPHLFAIASPHRKYYLMADNEENLTDWVTTLKEWLSRGKVFTASVDRGQFVEEGKCLAKFEKKRIMLTSALDDMVKASWCLHEVRKFSLQRSTLWIKREVNPHREELECVTKAGRMTDIFLSVPKLTGSRLIHKLKEEIGHLHEKPLRTVLSPDGPWQGPIHVVPVESESAKKMAKKRESFQFYTPDPNRRQKPFVKPYDVSPVKGVTHKFCTYPWEQKKSHDRLPKQNVKLNILDEGPSSEYAAVHHSDSDSGDDYVPMDEIMDEIHEALDSACKDKKSSASKEKDMSANKESSASKEKDMSAKEEDNSDSSPSDDYVNLMFSTKKSAGTI